MPNALEAIIMSKFPLDLLDTAFVFLKRAIEVRLLSSWPQLLMICCVVTCLIACAVGGPQLEEYRAIGAQDGANV